MRAGQGNFTVTERPYRGRDRKEIREAMVAREVAAKPSELPLGWSMHALDFMNRLLRRRAEQRLGTKGVSEVKSHPWLSDVDWKLLVAKEVASPFYVDVSAVSRRSSRTTSTSPASPTTTRRPSRRSTRTSGSSATTT